MRLGPVIHGVLLLVALVVAYKGATEEESILKDVGKHAVWEGAKVASISLESDKRTVVLERRTDEQGSYLWGTETKTRIIKTPAKDSAAAEIKPNLANDEPHTSTDGDSDALSTAEGSAALSEEVKTTVKEFPLGKEGRELFEQFENLKALRKIGKVEADKLGEYDLIEDTLSLAVVFAEKGRRDLVIAGETIYGGGDRYMMEVESGEVFVIAGDLFKPLNAATNRLSPKNMHSFEVEDAAKVLVRTSAGDKTLVRRMVDGEKGKREVWSDGEDGEEEAAYGTFLDRVKTLKASSYEPEIETDSLTHIATLRYQSEEGTALGFLELYRELPSQQDGVESGKTKSKVLYLIRTEVTRVPGRVGRMSAERIDQDLVELFGISPAPKSADSEPDPAPALPPLPGLSPPSPKQREDSRNKVPTPSPSESQAASAGKPSSTPAEKLNTVPAPKPKTVPAVPPNKPATP